MKNTMLLNNLVYENDFVSYFEGDCMVDKDALEDKMRKILEKLDYL
tara:strand:+ start:194 stop:331 length:138 start_codon:yes stop_codon:yes gene_type:complete